MKHAEILVNGFTYSGQLLHIVINYVLIFICLYPYFKQKRQYKKLFWKYWISIVSITLILQIYLWFAENVTGVSLIWSALAGLNILILVKVRQLTDKIMPSIQKLLWISLLSVLVADIYYWFIYPPITTIAHAAATFMGMGIYGIILLISTITGKSTRTTN